MITAGFIVVATGSFLAILVAVLVAHIARRREQRSPDAPTSHRAADHFSHARPAWQVTPATPARGLGVVRFLPGTVEDTVMFRAVTPAGPSTSGDAA